MVAHYGLWVPDLRARPCPVYQHQTNVAIAFYFRPGATAFLLLSFVRGLILKLTHVEQSHLSNLSPKRGSKPSNECLGPSLTSLQSNTETEQSVLN